MQLFDGMAFKFKDLLRWLFNAVNPGVYKWLLELLSQPNGDMVIVSY